MTRDESGSARSRTDGTAESRQVYRTVYRRKRDVERHPDVDPARLPVTVYSESDSLDFQQEDLTYLRTDPDRIDGIAEAWIETRTVTPWERTDA